MPRDEESDNQNAENEWKMVTHADRRRVIKGKMRRSRGNKPLNTATTLRWTPFELERILQTLLDCIQSIPKTDLYQSLVNSLNDRTTGGRIDQIVCFGVGNLAPRPSPSMWQLACALSLKTKLQGKGTLPLYFFDPVTSPEEADILTKHDVTVLISNEHGARTVHGRTTLFFMPHCPISLYRNVILTNWNVLRHQKVLFFGNSLSHYVDSDRNNGAGLVPLRPFMQEEAMEASRRDKAVMVGDFEGAFNDSYLVSFSEGTKETWPALPDEDAWEDQDDGELIL